MKNSYKILFNLLLLLVSNLLLSAQIDSDQSVALKTIRTIDTIPVVFQSEIKGGHHQYESAPWNTTNLPVARIVKGMLVTDNSTNANYQYIGDGTTNIEDDWRQVFFISQYVPTANYSTGDIVVSDSSLYQANTAITGNDLNKITDEAWDLFGTDDQKIETFRLDSLTNTLTVAIEDGDSMKVDMSFYQQDLTLFEMVDNDSLTIGLRHGDTLGLNISALSESVILDDKATPANNTEVVSGGETIILAVADVELPAASSLEASGRTYTIKNVMTADPTNGSALVVSVESGGIDDESSITLWRKYDYVTIISDGSSWFEIARGGTSVVEATADVSEVDEQHDDAFYLGDPNDVDSWRIVYDSTNKVLVVQCREASGWVNKTSIVP